MKTTAMAPEWGTTVRARAMCGAEKMGAEPGTPVDFGPGRQSTELQQCPFHSTV